MAHLLSLSFIRAFIHSIHRYSPERAFEMPRLVSQKPAIPIADECLEQHDGRTGGVCHTHRIPVHAVWTDESYGQVRPAFMKLGDHGRGRTWASRLMQCGAADVSTGIDLRGVNHHWVYRWDIPSSVYIGCTLLSNAITAYGIYILSSSGRNESIYLPTSSVRSCTGGALSPCGGQLSSI
jgi:hypothetical protein